MPGHIRQTVRMISTAPTDVTQEMITAGLRELGLDRTSSVLVHASLRSFGHVTGGAATVCRALTEVCGTVMVPSGTWDLTGLPAPPGLVRAHNAFYTADSWEDFDRRLAAAVPFAPDLPVDAWLGAIPEALRTGFSHARGSHPLFSFLAVGDHGEELINGEHSDWPLGPIDELDRLNGDVLLLGVGHQSNTTMHLAEQRLGRSRFYRYAKVADGVWGELPNVSGESHRFDVIEPHLRQYTTEIMIGNCRARRIPVRAVLATTDRLVRADPAALLCADPECRCGAALQQRLLHR